MRWPRFGEWSFLITFATAIYVRLTEVPCPVSETTSSALTIYASGWLFMAAFSILVIIGIYRVSIDGHW